MQKQKHKHKHKHKHTVLTTAQPRTALKPGTSPTGPARAPFPTCPASAPPPVAVTAAAVALATPALTPAVSADVRPSRATASRATLATGSAEDPSLHPLHLLPAKAAAPEVASKEVHVRAADSPPPGARVKALRALVDPAVSSRSDRNLRGSLLRQTMTTSGDPRCAPMRLSSRQHPHPTLARHHHRHRRPLHPPAALA